MAAVLAGRDFCGFPGVLLSRWPLRACRYRRGSADAARSRATDPAATRADPGPAQQTIRSPEQIAAFLSGLEMVEPGLVQLPQWRPDLGYTGPAGGITLSAYCGAGRKP